MKARRPVKLVYDRSEDMEATTKRHPSRVRHRTGLDRDGRLLAQFFIPISPRDCRIRVEGS